MIYFDTSRTNRQRHKSGLTRVTLRLAEEFGEAVRRSNAFQSPGRSSGGSVALDAGPSDWWLTAELFCEEECPGLWSLIRKRPCRLAAVYHDAIPLKLPHITWPQSVSRHAEYMKMLAEFDRVFAVSEASRTELLEFWAWQGVEPRAVVETVSLGADFSRQPRVQSEKRPEASVLCVGILEPRKNQTFLLDVCERLWRRGLSFDLNLVGRVNPHFGGPVVARVRELQKTWRCLHFYEAADDACLGRLFDKARLSAFPTLAEGCGLPLLESLWQGVPCVCSDLPVLRENADAGGCLPLAVNDLDAWTEGLGRLLTDDLARAELAQQARQRPLPVWSAAAQSLLTRLS